MKRDNWETRSPGDTSGLHETFKKYNRPRESEKKKNGILPDNPGFRIILYDVILILFIAVVFIPVSRRVLASGSEGDAHFRLSARQIDQVLVVSLKLTSSYENLDWNQPFSVTYYYNDDILGTTRFTYPGENEKLPVYFRERFPSPGWDAVQVRLEFKGAEAVELSCIVIKEESEE